MILPEDLRAGDLVKVSRLVTVGKGTSRVGFYDETGKFYMGSSGEQPNGITWEIDLIKRKPEGHPMRAGDVWSVTDSLDERLDYHILTGHNGTVAYDKNCTTRNIDFIMSKDPRLEYRRK